MRNSISIREHSILLLLKEGETPKTIAPIMGISVSTVKFYCRVLYARLGANNACHAVVLAMRAGWITLEEVKR